MFVMSPVAPANFRGRTESTGNGSREWPGRWLLMSAFEWKGDFSKAIDLEEETAVLNGENKEVVAQTNQSTSTLERAMRERSNQRAESGPHRRFLRSWVLCSVACMGIEFWCPLAGAQEEPRTAAADAGPQD